MKSFKPNLSVIIYKRQAKWEGLYEKDLSDLIVVDTKALLCLPRQRHRAIVIPQCHQPHQTFNRLHLVSRRNQKIQTNQPLSLSPPRVDFLICSQKCPGISETQVCFWKKEKKKKKKTAFSATREYMYCINLEKIQDPRLSSN